MLRAEMCVACCAGGGDDDYDYDDFYCNQRVLVACQQSVLVHHTHRFKKICTKFQE
jgi:hypothetical protein